MRNAHLEKSDRNQRIRKLLANGRTQTEVAREFNISVQRVNDLVQKWIWRGLLEKTKKGFVLPKRIIHRQRNNKNNKKLSTGRH